MKKNKNDNLSATYSICFFQLTEEEVRHYYACISELKNTYPKSIPGHDTCPGGWEAANVFLMFSAGDGELAFPLKL